MTKKEVKNLRNGIYIIYWKGKESGISEAAIGTMYNGDKWLAPANWTAHDRFFATTEYWKKIKKVVRVNHSI